MYEDFSGRVISKGNLSDTFAITTGVRQGCLLSPSLSPHYILKLRWPIKSTNEELWRITQQDDIAITIRKRQWNWIGHSLRTEANNITRQALDCTPQGERKQGRPKDTWRRSTLEEHWSELAGSQSPGPEESEMESSGRRPVPLNGVKRIQ